MRGFPGLSLPFSLVILTTSCHFEPPKPVLPDGSHRVPVNRVPPVPATSASCALPEVPVGGDGR